MDETTKQTSPAPWRVELETWSEGQKLAVVDADGRFVATIMTEEDMQAAGDVCLALAERDAALIAAAPELLAALRGCADALQLASQSFRFNNPMAAVPNLYDLHQEAARDAIAKAEGR